MTYPWARGVSRLESWSSPAWPCNPACGPCRGGRDGEHGAPGIRSVEEEEPGIDRISHLGELPVLPAADPQQVSHHVTLLLPVQLRHVLVGSHLKSEM